MKQDEIESLLPLVFQRAVFPGSPLSVLLEVMEQQHAPAEEALAQVESYIDPYRTPDEFLPYLAQWVDLGWLLPEDGGPFPGGLGRLRELIQASADLSRWRGTKRGLVQFLELATGLSGFTIDEAAAGPGGGPRAFHLVVQAPAAGRPFQGLMERIIQMQKPVYVTSQLVFST